MKVPDPLVMLSEKQRKAYSGYQAFIKHVLESFSNPIDYTGRMKEAHQQDKE